MEEHDKRFWRNMTFAQLRNRRVRVSAYGGDMILEFRLTPGIGHTLGARQYTVNGFDIGELFHEGHDGFMELTRQKAPVSIKLLPDEPEYKIIEDITGVQPGDVFVQTNGNKYPVQEITDDGHCLVLIDSNTYRIDDDAFDHALRPAPARIPDRPGLWEDKSDGLYTVWKNGQELWIMQIRESDGRWMNGPALRILAPPPRFLPRRKPYTGSSKVVVAVRFSTSGNSRNEIRTGTSTKRSKPSTMRERK